MNENIPYGQESVPLSLMNCELMNERAKELNYY